MRTVSIFGKEYNLSFGLRVLFKYELLTGHPFAAGTLEDSYRLMHAALLANNDDYALTFDELITACDDDPTLFSIFMEMVEESSKRAAQIKKKAARKAAAR